MEDYVSFETAKLLKEKGFDWDCFQYWHEEDNKLIHSQSIHSIQNISNPCFFGPAAPTLQMAMKWLREVHNLHIDAPITYQYFPKKYEAHIMHTEKYEDIVVNPGTNFNTYEDACEAAIKYCLENLI